MSKQFNDYFERWFSANFASHLITPSVKRKIKKAFVSGYRHGFLDADNGDSELFYSLGRVK